MSVGVLTFVSMWCVGWYLEVSGAFERLVADATDMAAVLAVTLPAVPPQHVGRDEHLIAEEALVQRTLLPLVRLLILRLNTASRNTASYTYI